MSPDIKKLYRIAFVLAIFTVVYNVLEGGLATFLGLENESLALFGFGVDSFIEVVSGVGIAHMIVRIAQNPDSPRDKFEQTALRITGFAFYALAIGLVISGVYLLFTSHKPENTFWGTIISGVSILIMLILVWLKIWVGKKLNSEPILADARCTLVCVYMSVTLLISSVLYTLFGLEYIDTLAALLLAWFSFKEGRECFEKAKSEKYCGCH